MDTIDLRSDTVTKPTARMRRAMAEAEVGDDVYGEDPTVNRLQSLAASLLGKEAALYVPSGTMANQLAIRVLASSGTEVLCPDRAHVYRYEGAVAAADTVMFCLSKGLGAPVGSVLCGPASVIAQARAYRARFGGGMRQAGVIAAAGVVALETMVERLADDHIRARRLADALASRWPGSVDPEKIRTNIVCADLRALPVDFVDRLGRPGVHAGTIDPRPARFVTHNDV